MRDTTITIPAEHAGARLDIALAALLHLTRSQAQKLIAQGAVRRNNKTPNKMGEKVKEGDVVVISHPALRPEAKGRGEKSLSQSRTDRDSSSEFTPSVVEGLGMTNEPKVIAATPDYLVVNKPAGVLTHPTQAKESNTLAGWLLKKYPEIKKVGDDPAVRPGIVHRLDKESSGLLVVARTQAMFDCLKEQFKKRKITKEYYALAHGKVAKDWNILTFPIARGKTHNRMAARPLKGTPAPAGIQPLDSRLHGNDKKEKPAATEFLVERRFVNFTLLRVTLHTGRMHQIRVHLLAYNHPLVGDPLYFQKKRKRVWDERLGRLFLHATKLSFTDLAGQQQTFESRLPKELEKFLQQLK